MEEGEKNAEAKTDLAIEFFEVAFHSILHHRKIYPKAIFCLRKKYQIPVYVSRHPEVNEYIKEALMTAKFLLKENGLKRIALVVVDGNEKPIERHCFDVEEDGESTWKETDDFYFVKTEEIFRDYLLKLSVSGGNEEEEEDGDSGAEKSFRIEITTVEKCSVRLNENPIRNHFPWIEADEKWREKGKFQIFPAKTLETSTLKLNMYVEK